MEKKKALVRMVTIPKSDLESLEATVETLENKYVMKQLMASEEAMKKGKVRKARDFLKEL